MAIGCAYYTRVNASLKELFLKKLENSKVGRKLAEVRVACGRRYPLISDLTFPSNCSFSMACLRDKYSSPLAGPM